MTCQKLLRLLPELHDRRGGIHRHAAHVCRLVVFIEQEACICRRTYRALDVHKTALPAPLDALITDLCSRCCYSVTTAAPPGSCGTGRRGPRPGWLCSTRSHAGSSPGWHSQDLQRHDIDGVKHMCRSLHPFQVTWGSNESICFTTTLHLHPTPCMPSLGMKDLMMSSVLETGGGLSR